MEKNYNDQTEQQQASKKNVKSSVITLVKEYLENKYFLRYNEINNEIEFKLKYDQTTDYKNLNFDNLVIELSEELYTISDSKLLSLLKSDFVPTYNPLKEYFENLPKWEPQTKDNQTLDNDHIKHLASFVTAKDTERFNIHFEKMFVRMIACALRKDFNKQAFILIGKQNDGKTTFLRFLCPSFLKDYYTEYLRLDHQDGEIGLAENFIINLDELANLAKKGIDVVKSMMSREDVNVRRPYARKTERTPRIANFLGSTNKDDFLTDSSGSVRWLCFGIDAIDFNYKSLVNIDLVYSQAYYLYKNGFEYKVTQEEVQQNEEANEQYQRNYLELELVQKYYEQDLKEDKANFKTATDILIYLRAITSLNDIKTNNIGKALADLKIPKKSLRTEKGSKKGYFLHQREN